MLQRRPLPLISLITLVYAYIPVFASGQMMSYLICCLFMIKHVHVFKGELVCEVFMKLIHVAFFLHFNRELGYEFGV